MCKNYINSTRNLRIRFQIGHTHARHKHCIQLLIGSMAHRERIHATHHKQPFHPFQLSKMSFKKKKKNTFSQWQTF